MPGKNDYKAVIKMLRVQEQKYLLLCHLKEAYELFKSKNQNIKIKFSKFAELRPKECVLASRVGTHCLHLYNTSKYETNDCGGSAWYSD